MAFQNINIGNIANDGTGDDLREAFVKVNNNFADLDQRVVIQADGENLGTGEGVYYVKTGNNMQFKSLIAGDNVSFTATANDITINAPDPIKSIQFNADTGTYSLAATGSIDLLGGQNINSTITGATATFNVDPVNLVQQDTSPTLGGALDGATNNISNVNRVTATEFYGDLTGHVHGHDMRIYVNALAKTIFGTDYGLIVINTTNGFDLMFQATSIDYGTVASPASLVSNYGTIGTPL